MKSRTTRLAALILGEDRIVVTIPLADQMVSGKGH